MPRKPQAPAPKGVAWDPDIYNIQVFVDALNDLRTKPESTMVPPVIMPTDLSCPSNCNLGNVVDNAAH